MIRLQHDDQLELTILASCYHHEDEMVSRIVEYCRPKYFHNEEYRRVFESILALVRKGAEVRSNLLLKSEGLPHSVIARMQSHAVPVQDPTPGCRQLLEYWLRNEGVRIAERLIGAFQNGEKKPQELCGAAARVLTELVTDSGPAEHLHSAAEVTKEIFDELNRDSRQTGLETNLRELNYLIGGFQRSELIILGARPSTGKTAIACNWLAHWADLDKKCLLVSAETSRKQLQKRQLARKSRVDGQLILNKPDYLGQQEIKQLVDSLSDVAWENLYYHDPDVVKTEDLFWVADLARHKMGGLDVIAIDYLQLLTIQMDRRNYTANDRVAEISKALKALAKRFDVPVIAISQLNRVAANQEPQMDHLRESGQLEQDADVILLMWKEEQAGIDCHYLKVEKQKNGRLGRVRLHLDGPHFEFSQMDEVHEEAV